MSVVIQWPASPEAERGALGCVLLDGTLAGELTPEWFYNPQHSALADMLRAMGNEGIPVDAMTVCQRATHEGIAERLGGSAYISEHADRTPSAAHWPHWVGILEAKAKLRRVIAAGYQAMTSAQATGADVDAVVEAFEKSALAINGDTAGDEVDLRATLRAVVDDLEAAHANPGQLRGIATGFFDLDRILGGLRNGQLVIVAARPSVGKTSLAMNIAERVAVDDRIPAGVFSLEMTAKELLHRMACCRARVDSVAGQSGRLAGADIERLTVAHAAIAKAPLNLCDHGGLTVGRLAGIARRMKQRHGIKLLLVDYLQLLRTGDKGRSRYEEVTAISNSLKLLAKDLHIPVIALAQLSRDVEKGDRKPRLSDLRDSGAIEQDADIVALLHRDGDATGNMQRIELIVAKHRSGPTGKVDLRFNRSFTRFESA